jgi:hypothetical protein
VRRVLAAWADQALVVPEIAADPGQRSRATRNEPQLLTPCAIVLRVAREGRECRKELVAEVERDQEIRLIALALVGVRRIARCRDEFRESEVRRDLERREPVLALVPLAVARPSLVPAGAERHAMIRLPSADFHVLQVVREIRVDRVRRLPAQSDSRSCRLLGVDVVHAVQIRRNVCGRSEVRLRIRDTRLVDEERRVDESGVVDEVEVRAERKRTAERQVDREAAVETKIVAFGETIRATAEGERCGVEFRSPRDVADRAAERPCTIERALRPEQHLDTIHVGESQVDVERDIADIRRHDFAAVVPDGFGSRNRIQVQSPDDDLVRRALALVDNVHSRHVAAELRERADFALLQQIAVERCDVDRDILNALASAGCRDEHLLDGPVLRKRCKRRRRGGQSGNGRRQRGLPQDARCSAQEHRLTPARQ